MTPIILTCPYCGHNVPMSKGAIASDCPECGKAVFRPLRSVEILQKFGHGVQSTKTDPCGTPGGGVHEPPTMPKGAGVIRAFCEDIAKNCDRGIDDKNIFICVPYDKIVNLYRSFGGEKTL